MAQIALRNVKKSFGKLSIIHGIDAEFADGEFIVIVGPSGCGKSTLLRMIAGLETVSEGEIEIGGRVVNSLEPKERNVAMVFQNYALYPHMTVFNNMAYGLRIAGKSKTEIRERVERAAKMLDLTELLERMPRQLSGGQRQRVAMGRCIVREPAVFLFDEPLSNLDAKLRVQMRLEIKQLHQRLGVTSIYVTHDQVEAMTLGDRLVVMNGGVAEQIGKPIEIYRRPATTFVAGFIGSPSMNLVPARVGADGHSIELPNGEALAVGGFSAAPGLAVTVGIRPEHFEPAGEERRTVHLSVHMVEQLGADTLIHGHFGDDRTPLTARLPGSCGVVAGESVSLSVAPDHLHVFAADSGRRIG